MGWAVGWDTEHRRFRGYGVPAWCDAYAKGCREQIDRGLGYVCEAIHHYYDVDEDGNETETGEEFNALDHPIFVCGNHTCEDVDENDLPPEHPDWLAHVLTDDSWATWRDENPETVDKYQASLETQRKLSVVPDIVEDEDE